MNFDGGAKDSIIEPINNSPMVNDSPMNSARSQTPQIKNDKKIEINLMVIFVFLTLIEFLQVLTTRNFVINDLLFNFVGYD